MTNFDIESFFAGLQAGLRLGRAPQGRIPPPPSNSYIITEDEDDIVTETGEYIITE